MSDSSQQITSLRDGKDSASPREGELLKRRHRRRNDLSTLGGISREEIRLYHLMMAGKLTLAQYEIASRGLGRHAGTVRLVEEVAQVADLQRRLAELQQRSTPVLPAPVSIPEPAQLPEWAVEPEAQP